MEDRYPEELWYPLPQEEEEDDAVSSRIDSGRQKPKMIGLSDVYSDLKGNLITHKPTELEVLSIVGMPGIGKSTLASKIFEDQDINRHFSCCAWVKVGRKCQLKEIPRRILAEVNPDCYKVLAEGDEDTAHEYLKESLKGKRYLIILDDVWDQYMKEHLQPSYSYNVNLLLDEQNGSRVLLTTRQQPAYETHSERRCILRMRLLNKKESWDLLRQKVFADGLCPSQLENAGKKIAKNCDGLPLTIITVANLLSKAEMTPKYWSEIAEQKHHHLFKAAYDEMSEVIFSSYKHLPRVLQMYFLYMGIFPQNYEILRSKLINMWEADGFPELKIQKFHYPHGMICLKELVSNGLVMTYQSTVCPTPIDDPWLLYVDQAKTCGLHSSIWHFCNREAEKNKFSLVLNCYGDGVGEGIEKQRRLSFHNNILFGINDVYKSVEDNCAYTAHALLCYGPYHQYQVPICFNLKLLRELDALTIRFYEFPKEVLQLYQLRYLALTLNGELPCSISQLSNLQFLIINPHLSIKSYREPLYLPTEIWNMNELKQIQVMGSDLADPPRGASMKSLSKLSHVSAHSCIEGVLQAIPSLEKLGIRVELAPDDDGKPFSFFDHISHLKRLISLNVVVNPEVVTPLAPLSVFPLYLKKLSLSGLGYPWKEMSKIASLKHLVVLKLRNYAFRGPEWEVNAGFGCLRSLVIEDTDLVEWKIRKQRLMLSYLSIKHCYKLEKVHGELHVGDRSKIKLVDCNPFGVKQIKKAIWTSLEEWMKVELSVHSSWDDGKLKT